MFCKVSFKFIENYSGCISGLLVSTFMVKVTNLQRYLCGLAVLLSRLVYQTLAGLKRILSVRQASSIRPLV